MINCAKRKREIIEWGFFTLFSVFVMLFIDQTSPLCSYVGFDYNVFLYLTHCWKEGYLPYEYFFDHKGPVFYLIFRLADFICEGKIGVAILAIISFTLVQKLTLEIIRLLLKVKRDRVIAFIFSIMYFIMTLYAGYLPEPFVLLFMFLPLYLVVKFLTSQKPIIEHPLWYSVVYSASFAIIALMKANYGFVSGGIVVGFTILFIKEREFKVLFKNFIACVVGVALVFVPVFMYLYSLDILDDMYNAYWKFNMVYKESWATSSVLSISGFKNIIRLLPAIYAIIVASLLYKKTGDKLIYFIAPGGLMAIYLLIGGANGYVHYYMSLMPFFVISIILTIILFKGSRLFVPAIIVLIIVLNLYNHGSYSNILTHYRSLVINVKSVFGGKEVEKCNFEFLDCIPNNERDSIYLFLSNPRELYPMLISENIFPVNRYKFHSRPFHRISADVRADIDNFNATTDALWIVTDKSYEDEPIESMKELLARYTLVNHDTELKSYLYKRSDTIEQD